MYTFAYESNSKCTQSSGVFYREYYIMFDTLTLDSNWGYGVPCDQK